MICRLAALLGLSLAATSPAQADEAPRWVVRPVWQSRPTQREMYGFFPLKAEALSHGGAAALRCVVEGSTGKLRRCEVIGEVPQGEGFGAAALAMSSRFTLDMKATKGASDGVFLLLTLTFESSGGGGVDYKFKLKPGDGAFVATVATAKLPAGAQAFSCPSETAPKRQCEAHSVIWEGSPDWRTSEALIEAADQTDGVALMECRIGTDRRLSNCKVDGATPHDEAALIAFAQEFKAGEVTGDILTTPGRQVVLRFDWRELSKLRGLGLAIQPDVPVGKAADTAVRSTLP